MDAKLLLPSLAVSELDESLSARMELGFFDGCLIELSGILTSNLGWVEQK
jgi:hypothetical protein